MKKGKGEEMKRSSVHMKPYFFAENFHEKIFLPLAAAVYFRLGIREEEASARENLG